MEASVPTNPREKGAELLGDFRPRMVWNVDVSTHQKANHWTCWVKAEKRMQVRRAIHFEAHAFSGGAHAPPGDAAPAPLAPVPRALGIREVHHPDF